MGLFNPGMVTSLGEGKLCLKLTLCCILLLVEGWSKYICFYRRCGWYIQDSAGRAVLCYIFAQSARAVEYANCFSPEG